MAASSSCFLNLPAAAPSPPSATSSHPPKAFVVARPEKGRSWRSHCVVAAACIVMGLETNGLMGGEGVAAAGESIQAAVVESKKTGTRWSEKRACPPWRVNSLETIVPENLPRPSARRRWEAVGHTTTAPPVKTGAGSGGGAIINCFAL
ncbi:protein CHLOROPLAST VESICULATION [Diospyros lotus]|uniref:protein CHLOROPLAST VESICULATION n=1 Tax=Diospyros lotus TaxID=55363 RepID=UPI00225875AD|nr:protein CHLOROPLAST VESICULATION [Diospyros lotus]